MPALIGAIAAQLVLFILAVLGFIAFLGILVLIFKLLSWLYLGIWLAYEKLLSANAKTLEEIEELKERRTKNDST